MRVLLSGMDGGDIEGELVSGGFVDPDTGEFDLEDTITVRCDDGTIVHALGWLVDVTVLQESNGG